MQRCLLAAMSLMLAGFVWAGSAHDEMNAQVYWRLTLDADGNVAKLSPTLIKANRTLREALEPAIRKWKFSPGQINGKPAETETTLSVGISLVAANDGDDYSIQFDYVQTGGSVGNHNRPPRMTGTQVEVLKASGSLAEVVVLLATYDTEGRIAEIVAAEGSPVTEGRFYESARETVQTWKFIPERVAGIGISGQVIIPFCYSAGSSDDEKEACKWTSPNSKSEIPTGQGLAVDSKVRLLTDLNPKSP